MAHRFIVWGSGKARDHLIHSAAQTDRARRVAEYFRSKYWESRSICAVPIGESEFWAVEVEPTCPDPSIYAAEGQIDLRTRGDGAVHGWIRIGFDPETGEEMIWDEATRVI